MTITIQNVSPQHWVNYNQVLPLLDYRKDNYGELLKEELATVLKEKCFTPLNKQLPATIQIINQQQTTEVDPKQLAVALLDSFMNETIDLELTKQINQILSKTFIHYTPNNWIIEDQLINESITLTKQPLPGYNDKGQFIQYDANYDVLPTSKELLNACYQYQTTKDLKELATQKNAYFAALGGYMKSKCFDTNYIALTFKDDEAIDDFFQFVLTSITNVSTNVQQDINKIKKSLKFDKTFLHGLFMAQNDIPKANGLPRYLLHQLALFERGNPEKLAVQALNMKELYVPNNLIIINLEKLTQASDKKINKEFQTLNQLKKKSIFLIDNKQLVTLASVKQAQKIFSQDSSNKERDKAKKLLTSNVFSKKPKSKKDLAKLIAKTIKNKTTNMVTKNTYKTQSRSYMRANRREPFNLNKQGTMTSVRYHPDIHLFVDTSGSITEPMYQSTTLMLIEIAQKLNVDMYITFFSDVLSETSLLKIKNKSAKVVFEQIRALPKVTGGTDFDNVWRYIDCLDKKVKGTRAYYIITDFGYYLNKNERFSVNRPAYKDVNYIPVAEHDVNEYQYIVKYAKSFVEQMERAGARNIRSRLLM